MDHLRSVVDELVRAGIRSYIGLLGLGEQERSRRIFSDALQLSALVSGGPSARIPASGSAEPSGPLTKCLVLFTVRSMLATLLVLKTTAFWRKLPELEGLLDCCIRAAEAADGSRDERGTAESYAPLPAGSEALTVCSNSCNPGGETSGRTAGTLNCVNSHSTGVIRGCRRNSALPTRPELSYQPAGNGE